MKVLFYEHIATSVYKEHELKRRCKYSTIIKKLGVNGHFCIVDGDETLYYPDCKDLKPKSEVIHIKRIPQKGGGNLVSAVVGAVMVAAGVVTGILVGWTGVGAGVAAGLIVSGASMMVGAGISELMTKKPNVPSLKEQSQQEERYGLTGTSNKVSLGSKYPVIFGKHVITPPIVGNYYTELENNNGTGDQFMRVLLCVGYNQLSLKDFKIGLNELASNSGDIRNGRIPVTGTYDAKIEIRQNGLYPDLYPYRKYEEQISAEVKYFASEAEYKETRTTVKNTTGIYIILSFQGLYSVSSAGDYQNSSATIGVKYRPKSGGAWKLLAENTYTNNKNAVLRYFVQKTFSAQEMQNNPTGEWEVIVYRTSPTSTSSTSVNKCYWATLRSDTEQRPVIQKELDKMCVVALQIRANEQTRGILDQISCVAQSVFPVWNGEDWNTSQPTSNPASCYLGALRSNFLTKKVADDRIDWQALQNFSEWCDTNGYECNGVISNGEQVFNILNKILQTSRANFYLKDGLYSLTHDIPTTNPVALFTPKNSRNFTAQKLFPTHIDGMDVTFNDASNNWEADNQIIYPYGYVEQGDETNQEMNAWGVTSYAQAVKLARYILACNELRPEIYQLTVGLENFSIPLGSRCLIQNDVLLVGLTGGRIKSVDGQRITLDEVVKVNDTSKNYGLKIFHTDGTITSVQVNTPTIETDTLTAQGQFVASVGDIYAFGVYGQETIDCIVTGKTIGENLSGTLTFMPYAPEVFNCDSQPIPDYDPHMTKPMQQGYSIIGESLEPSRGVAVQDDGVVYYDFANYAMHDDAGNYFYNRGALLDLGKGYWSGLTFNYDGLYWANSAGSGNVHFDVDNTLYKNTSISFFMKGLTLSSARKYIWQYNDAQNDNILELYTENNSLFLNIQNYIQEITGYDFTQKHHFCIIREIGDGGFSIYIDDLPYIKNKSYGTFTYNLISETGDNLIAEDGNNLTSEEFAVGIEDLDRSIDFCLFNNSDGDSGASCSIAKFRLYRRVLEKKDIDILSSDGIISSMIEILNRYLGDYVAAPDESKIGDTFDYSGTTNDDFINGKRYVRTLSGWVLYGG